MANISAELQAILDAIYGEDVRGSIHDAIEKINDVSEVVLSCGTAVTSTSSSSSGFYDDSIYINTNTCDLWRCVGVNTWSLVGNLKGTSVTAITLKSTVGLIDTYEITYSDKPATTFTVTNGRGIVSVTKSTVGLKDTYTILYNDASTTTFEVDNGVGISKIEKNSTQDKTDTYTITYNNGTTTTYNVTNGVDGNRWFRGTDINGKQTNPTVFSGSGITLARVNDYYINPSEGAIYYCVLEGDPNTALWVYDFTLNGGGGGVSTWGELLKKPFNYVGGNGLEITGSTESDYTLQAKVDGSYVKTDANGALTINPDVLKGVYKYNTTDFKTDDTSKIVYLSEGVHNQLSKLSNVDGKISSDNVCYGSTSESITNKLSSYTVPQSSEADMVLTAKSDGTTKWAQGGSSEFVGTQAQWNAVADKSKYDGKIVNITDDMESNICKSVNACVQSATDKPTNNNDVAGVKAISELNQNLNLFKSLFNLNRAKKIEFDCDTNWIGISIYNSETTYYLIEFAGSNSQIRFRYWNGSTLSTLFSK